MEPARGQRSLDEFIGNESSDDRRCPTCGDLFKSKAGMHGHHVRAHDKSIAKTEFDCHYCGETFFDYESQTGDRAFCDQDCLNKWRSESDFNAGEKNGRYKDREEDRICDYCGDEYYRRPSDYSYYENNFCSTECFALFRSETYVGENHPRWKGGHTDWRGDNWDAERKRALERDDYECVLCGRSQETHIELIGQGLSVHHITPFREFDSPEEANKLDNLITLCSSCHGSVEPVSQKETV